MYISYTGFSSCFGMDLHELGQCVVKLFSLLFKIAPSNTLVFHSLTFIAILIYPVFLMSLIPSQYWEDIILSLDSNTWYLKKNKITTCLLPVFQHFILDCLERKELSPINGICGMNNLIPLVYILFSLEFKLRFSSMKILSVAHKIVMLWRFGH